MIYHNLLFSSKDTRKEGKIRCIIRLLWQFYSRVYEPLDTPLIFDRFLPIWGMVKKNCVKKKNNDWFVKLQPIFLWLVPVKLQFGRLWRNSFFFFRYFTVQLILGRSYSYLRKRFLVRKKPSNYEIFNSKVNLNPAYMVLVWKLFFWLFKSCSFQYWNSYSDSWKFRKYRSRD